MRPGVFLAAAALALAAAVPVLAAPSLSAPAARLSDVEQLIGLCLPGDARVDDVSLRADADGWTKMDDDPKAPTVFDRSATWRRGDTDQDVRVLLVGEGGKEIGATGVTAPGRACLLAAPHGLTADKAAAEITALLGFGPNADDHDSRAWVFRVRDGRRVALADASDKALLKERYDTPIYLLGVGETDSGMVVISLTVLIGPPIR